VKIINGYENTLKKPWCLYKNFQLETSNKKPCATGKAFLFLALTKKNSKYLLNKLVCIK
jgi:hypothetical protein